MNRGLFLLLVLSFAGACRAQQPLQKRAVDNERVPEQGHFATAGEQDEYSARKLFQEKYLYHEYARFKGPILVSSGEGKYRLSYARDTLMAELNPAFRPLLTEGILYPHVAGFSFQNICCFRELPHATNSPQRRRLVFWSFEPLMLNPTVYVLEVKNSQATEKTDLETFLKGAVLTFIQKGWIIL